MHPLPFENLAEWRHFLARADIPILAESVACLAELRANESDARHIAGTILDDPLLCVRLLAHFAQKRSRRQITDITTIEGTILMLGLEKFYTAFESVPTVEGLFAEQPEALAGLMRVVTRARNASNWGRDWAARRNDHAYEEITISALLHDIAEMLVWCFQPSLALELKTLQEMRPTLRSRVAQKAVLGIQLRDLQLALVREWHLPELIATLMDEAHANDPRVRNVALAVNLARHADHGWNDPALTDDFTAIGALLHLEPERVRELVIPAAETELEG